MFTSLEFWLYTALVLVAYQIIPGKWQNLLLLVASYAIYTYLEPRLVILLAAMTAFNFWIGPQLKAAVEQRRRYLWAAITVNLGILALFKYSLGLITVMRPILGKLGIENAPLITQVILPLGLSFYSFRALAYLFDVYNGVMEPEISWVDFSLYISFFPQIVSGPIVRPQPFISALKLVRRLSQQQFVDGLTFIFIGLFYKVAIADPLFSPLVPTVSNIRALTSADAWSEFILFTIRIYADFAGYSLLAIGVSVWFGLPIVQNFRQPYFSRTISEFWDRWHMSLSSWIRDYIFYPMSRTLLRRWGNQRARTIQVIAFIISMTLSGMWHGTGLKFIVWGAIHGIYLSIERIFFPKARIKSKNATRLQIWARTIIGIAVTLTAVSIAWVFFRVDSLTGAFVFFQQMFSSNPLPLLTSLWWIKILSPIVLLLMIDIPQAVTDNPLFIWQQKLIWRAAICTIFLIAIFIFGSQTHAPFIYFQF
jgi:alginate O-acetyltransferase complex protein AlgI